MGEKHFNFAQLQWIGIVGGTGGVVRGSISAITTLVGALVAAQSPSWFDGTTSVAGKDGVVDAAIATAVGAFSMLTPNADFGPGLQVGVELVLLPRLVRRSGVLRT